MSMTFVIPDNYPAELFPIECKIATNKMNANDDLGIQLPIIMEKCEYDVTDDNGNQVHVTSDLGYKYVYTATEPGVQKSSLHWTPVTERTSALRGIVELVRITGPIMVMYFWKQIISTMHIGW